MGKTEQDEIVLLERIEPRILLIRSQRVILDADLAELERKVASHDESIQSLVSAIGHLMKPAGPRPVRAIGFHVREERK